MRDFCYAGFNIEEFCLYGRNDLLIHPIHCSLTRYIFNSLYYKLPYFKVRRTAVFDYNWLSKNTLTQLYFCVTFTTTCFDLKVPSSGSHLIKYLKRYTLVSVIRCQTLLEDLWTIWSLLLICILLLSHSFIFFRFYFVINVYTVLFLFNNVIYVFLLLWLCICIVCLCMATLTEVFPCFFLISKANARVKPAKTGHCPHSS